MESDPNAPIAVPNSKFSDPQTFDATKVDAKTHPYTVPRYIPESTYVFSPGSICSDTLSQTGNYTLSFRSENKPGHRYRRSRPADLDSLEKDSSPPLEPSRTLPKIQNADEDIQGTWKALVSLLECFEIESTSAVNASSLLGQSTPLNQQTPGNSAKPGPRKSSRASTATQRKFANGSPKDNKSGRGLSPDDNNEDDDLPFNGGGGNVNDLLSTTGRRASSHKHFACPFHKSDPVRYASCQDAHFKDIDSVSRVSLNYLSCDSCVAIRQFGP